MRSTTEVGAAQGLPQVIQPDRKRRMGVLVNPQSGTDGSGIASLQPVLDRHPEVVWRQVVTPEDVALALKDMASSRVDMLAVSGGDGTVQAVLTELFRGKPFAAPLPLAVLAGGTTNMTAADVGVAGEPARALQTVLAWANGEGREARVVKRAVLRVDCGPDRAPVFGMFFNAAGIVEVTRARWESRRKAKSALMRGGLGTAATVSKYLLGLVLGRGAVAPTRISVELDGQRQETAEYLALFITGLVRMAGGIRPYWGEGPGPLRYTAIAYRPKHLILAASALLRGRPNRYLTPEHGYVSHNVGRVVLELATDCALDGEILTRTPQHPVVIAHAGEAGFLRL